MNAKQFNSLVESYNGKLYVGKKFEENDQFFDFRTQWDDQDEADDFLNEPRISIKEMCSDFELGIWTVHFNLNKYECPKCGEDDFSTEKYHHCR